MDAVERGMGRPSPSDFHSWTHHEPPADPPPAPGPILPHPADCGAYSTGLPGAIVLGEAYTPPPDKPLSQQRLLMGTLAMAGLLFMERDAAQAAVGALRAEVGEGAEVRLQQMPSPPRPDLAAV